MYYINTFLFYSIIGHLFEGLFYQKIDSGILYGYWTPIYGLGVLTILFINYFICKKIKKKLIRPIVLFISCAIILGLLELISGILIEEIFGRIFWDYSNEFLSIFKYTSVKMMLVWGTFSILFIYIIHPYINIVIKKIPSFIFYCLAFLFILDLFYTFINISNYNIFNSLF